MELKRIVHVDDDEDIRTIVKLALETVGQMEVVQFSDGPSALAGIADTQPDLFLFDVMMPDMTGPELRAEIAKLPGFDDVPTIFVTAKAEENFTKQLREDGALAVITKPFDPMTLSDTLESIWKTRT